MQKIHTKIVRKLLRGTAWMLAAAMLMISAASCHSGEKPASDEPAKVLDSREEASLKAFLVSFVKRYPVSSDGKWEYDCSSAAGAEVNIMACLVTPASCADWTLYSGKTEEECFFEKSDDPKRWAEETYVYFRYDAGTVDFIAREIFNLTQETIESLTQRGEREGMFYRQEDSYYTVRDDTQESFSEVTLLSEAAVGNRYQVEFEADTLLRTDENDELLHISGRCRAELSLKSVDGREYWSLYSFKAGKM